MPGSPAAVGFWLWYLEAGGGGAGLEHLGTGGIRRTGLGRSALGCPGHGEMNRPGGVTAGNSKTRGGDTGPGWGGLCTGSRRGETALQTEGQWVLEAGPGQGSTESTEDRPGLLLRRGGAGLDPGLRNPSPSSGNPRPAQRGQACLSPHPHLSPTPTGTSAATTLSELLSKLPSPASSAWATLRVSPE